MIQLNNKTNAIRKAVRTGLQVAVALIPAVLLALGGIVPAATLGPIALALTPVVTFCQNLLEDKGIIGTILRRPTPVEDGPDVDLDDWPMGGL